MTHGEIMEWLGWLAAGVMGAVVGASKIRSLFASDGASAAASNSIKETADASAAMAQELARQIETMGTTNRALSREVASLNDMLLMQARQLRELHLEVERLRSWGIELQTLLKDIGVDAPPMPPPPEPVGHHAA